MTWWRPLLVILLATTAQAAVSVAPRLLPLAGPVADRDAEISALCWCRDNLVLMPQHPERFADGDDELGVFTIPREMLETALSGDRPDPITPRRLQLQAPGLIDHLPGWDGIEAAVAVGDTVFFAVEARVQGRMRGYLLRGALKGEGDGLCLAVDPEATVPIDVPTQIPNMSNEALVVLGDRLAVLFEANGENINPQAHVALYDFDLTHRETVPLEAIEYRLTDATQPAADGTFWVINYFFPGERRLLDPPDPPDGPVEQLLQLRRRDGRFERTAQPAIDLRGDLTAPGRNWEALVRLDQRGFLLMTDRYPTTLLAFVPWAEATPESGATR